MHRHNFADFIVCDKHPSSTGIQVRCRLPCVAPLIDVATIDRLLRPKDPFDMDEVCVAGSPARDSCASRIEVPTRPMSPT